MNDHDLAYHLADAAGRLLMELRAAKTLNGKALGDTGDAIAQLFLAKSLAVLRPDDGILSEEAPDDKIRLGKSRVWIVDPLDGTREYSEGRPDWAVHVGLAVDGRAALGAVAQPALGVTYRSDTIAMQACQGPLRIVVSRTRPPEIAEAVAGLLGAQLVPMGSAGAKILAVVRGEAHAYVHAGGQFEWDSAAPVAVAQAAGLHISRLDGAALEYNCENPYLPDLVVSQPQIQAELMDALAKQLAQASLPLD